MLKKIFIYIAAIVAGAYLLFAIFFLTKREEGELCKGVEISISDGGYGALSPDNVKKILSDKGINLKGLPIDEISCTNIEKLIGQLPVVEECQSYKTHKGYIGINIECKIPIMQAYDAAGREFFIDKSGAVIDGIHNAMYLPVASGFVTRAMADKELLKVAMFLEENRFWNEQIEQIYFNEKKEIILVPRIGNHVVEVGKIDNLEKKLDKLQKFYEKGLNSIGWNKYKKINVEFDKQVICTKRD